MFFCLRLRVFFHPSSVSEETPSVLGSNETVLEATGRCFCSFSLLQAFVGRCFQSLRNNFPCCRAVFGGGRVVLLKFIALLGIHTHSPVCFGGWLFRTQNSEGTTTLLLQGASTRFITSTYRHAARFYCTDRLPNVDERSVFPFQWLGGGVAKTAGRFRAVVVGKWAAKDWVIMFV